MRIGLRYTKDGREALRQLLRSDGLRSLIDELGEKRVKRVLEKEAEWTALWRKQIRITESVLQEAAEKLIAHAIPAIGVEGIKLYADDEF